MIRTHPNGTPVASLVETHPILTSEKGHKILSRALRQLPVSGSERAILVTEQVVCR
jgi:hypothetical protein